MHDASIARRTLAALAIALLLLGGCKPRSYETRDRPEDDVLVHTVVEGDTLSRIAHRYRLDVQTILDANRLRDVELYVGQQLRLPGARERYTPKPAPPAAPKPPDTGWFKGRQTWSVLPIDERNIDRMETIRRITVHHSGDVDDLGADPAQTLQRIERQHKAGEGKNEPFACIGYHFLISADGTVWEGRPLRFQGAHATGDNNKGNIGVCLLGNFDHAQPTPAQQGKLIELLDRLCRDHKVRRDEVVGHNHFKVTDCPGKHLEPIVERYARGR